MNAIIHNNIFTYSENLHEIKSGDTFGTLINMHTKTMRFILNGVEISGIYNIHIEPNLMLPCITLYDDCTIVCDWDYKSYIPTDTLDRSVLLFII